MAGDIETILTELAPHLDSYSAELRRIYDPIFAREYRWAARLHSNPRYDLTLYPPRGEADEPVLEKREPSEPGSGCQACREGELA